MRELDLLLTTFLTHGYPSLSTSDQRAFEELLEYPDLDLLAWIIGREHAPNEGLARIVEAIQKTPCRA